MQKWAKCRHKKLLSATCCRRTLSFGPNYSAAEYFLHTFSPVAKYSIDKQAKFHDLGQTADGQFGKYIGLHFFPLRRLLVDNCVESSVNYKKIFGGFTLPDLNLFPISAMEILKAFSVILHQ